MDRSRSLVVPVLLVAMHLLPAARAAENGDAAATFVRYWTAYASGDYSTTANSMCAADLKGLQSELLPLFERLAQFNEPEPRQMYETFFDGVPKDEHAALDDRQVFVLLQKFIAKARPDYLAAVKESTVTPLQTSIDASDSALATVRYRLAIGTASQTGLQQLRLAGDGWCLVPPETVADTVARFKKAFRM
ncbi:MAG: hypothetical protein U1F06_05730 [Steroidobacteraceae bacterium]